LIPRELDVLNSQSHYILWWTTVLQNLFILSNG
jgi:hypothetical protein